MYTRTFLILVAILFISLSGYGRVKQVITSDAHSTNIAAAVKIGVIQPLGYYTGFAQGAELAQTQINNSGGLLGKQIELIVMDNQGARPVPDTTQLKAS